MNGRKPKMGRPPVAKDKAKSSLLSVRLSEPERVELEQLATQEGLKLSEWVRKTLLAAVTDRR